MGKKSLLCIILLVTSTFLCLTQVSQGSSTGFQPVGPNIDRLVYKVMPLLGYGTEQTALTSGQVDFIPNIGSFAEAQNLTTNNNVTVFRSQGGSDTLSAIFFNLRRSPCNDTVVRQAISYLADRNYICGNLMNGWATPVTTFVPISDSWTNLNATAHGFDFQKARTMLDNSGYTIDSLGWRINPKTGMRLNELTVVSPTWSSDPILWDIGYTIAYYLNATGIPAIQIALPDYLLLDRIMNTRNFDLCIADMSLAQAPFGLYAFLHSSRDTTGTVAYSGIHNSTLDAALQQLWYSSDKTTAQNAALSVQSLLSEQMPYVPICSAPQISAVSSNWTGLVNMPGYGADNMWTYLGVHTNAATFGGTFTQSILGNFSTLNPCNAANANDWKVLQQIYSPLFTIDPVTLQETPVLAKSWTIDPWTTPQGNQGMVIKVYLQNNIVWQDNQPFTSSDVKFCIDYLKNNNITNYNSVTSKILSVNAPNQTTVEVYFNETGYRHLYDLAWFTFMPQHVWQNITNYLAFQPWNETNPIGNGLTKLVGQGPFILSKCNLNNSVELVWNPLYFMKNATKPNLVQGLSVPQSAILGDTVTFRYQVLNFTGGVLSASNSGFMVFVNKSDGSSVLNQSTTLLNNGYEARIDTTKLGGGNFTITFMAAPYGSDTTQFTVTSPTPTPVIPEFPAQSIELTLVISMTIVLSAVIVARPRYTEKTKAAKT